MTLLEAIKERHTVRNYTGQAISGKTLQELETLIAEVNREGGLHFQLVNGQENAFAPFTSATAGGRTSRTTLP